MENLNYFFLIVVVCCLFYFFLKSRSLKKHDEKSKKEDVFLKKEKEMNDYELYVIMAVIALIMEKKKHRIRKLFIADNENKRHSEWKITGRNESMMRRLFFGKR